MPLNDIQLDLLKEAFNLGVGHAAYALSELAGGDEIELTVPQLSFKSLDDLIQEVYLESGGQVCGVSEKFNGLFPGRAMLLYSQKESLELVKVMLQGSFPVDLLSEMEGEALCEVGNIVLNACISSLANLLGGEIQTEVPCLHIGTPSEILSFPEGQEDRVLLHLRMSFNCQQHSLMGHIGFLLELPSMDLLVRELDAYFQRSLNLG